MAEGARSATLKLPAFLIVDEIGRLPVTTNGANLLLQPVCTAASGTQQCSLPNKCFKEWGAIFGDSVLAVPLLDRVLHRCNIANSQGNSYRLRKYLAPTPSPRLIKHPPTWTSTFVGEVQNP